MEKREITGVQGQVNNIEVIFKEYYGSLLLFRFPVLEKRGGDRGSCAGCFYRSTGEEDAFPIRSTFEKFLVFIYSKLLFKLYPQYPFERSVYCFVSS